MPKDINPMPPRTFRGGFLFVQINPHPSKAAIQADKENCGFSVSVGDILERRLYRQHSIKTPFPCNLKQMFHVMMDAFPVQYVSPLIKKIARRTNRRAIFIVSFFNQFLYLPFSSAFLILAASSAASASRRASRLLSRYSKSSLLPTTSEL